ncbi:PhzF family phenazine biosynthesis protein [Marinivivus vitaminiproducens]|uniref:PhzF family phenazine biosynthesis protein n=1 Tax=Marinivivus vitaminiproducens TaxID=3035935 RepID=UPI0027A55BD0|nr:PhzF family phenazine biosynthesis protein [Geminicoccaceae bacterium SCSIO 64248]
MRFAFETVDVFTERRFGGNPLAVFPSAIGLSDAAMQALAAEFNLSETTFVLPPDDPANTVRMRIFNRTAEMAFAGHPSVGTAFVLARAGMGEGDALRLEVPAGVVAVEMERDAGGDVIGGRITAPQPLSLGAELPREAIAACASLAPDQVIVTGHAPVVASMGNPYVIAEVAPDALDRAQPDLRAFREAAAGRTDMGGRFSIFVYARGGADIRARMFAPLSGTFEDPATGSANTPLAGLLLSLSGDERADFSVMQGEAMGRPSLLRLHAWRGPGGITASVAGRCVPVLRGEAEVGADDAQ